MRKNIRLMVVLGIFIMSCGSGSNNVAEVPSSFNTTELYANAKQLEKLISKEDIAQITGIKIKEISAYQENFDDDAATQFLLFSWKNGESIEAGSEKIDAKSSIGFGRLQKISAPDFAIKCQQKTLTQLKAEIEKITSNDSIGADAAIWEAKEIAKRAKAQAFEKVENVGNEAYWETPTGVLHVFVDGLTFTISANFKNDDAENKQKAIKLAQLIFNKQFPKSS